MTTNRYRYHVHDRETGRHLFSTNSDLVAQVPKPHEVVYDDVTGTVNYLTRVHLDSQV